MTPLTRFLAQQPIDALRALETELARELRDRIVELEIVERAIECRGQRPKRPTA